VAHGGPRRRLATPGQRSRNSRIDARALARQRLHRMLAELNSRNRGTLAAALRRAVRRAMRSLTDGKTVTSAGGITQRHQLQTPAVTPCAESKHGMRRSRHGEEDSVALTDEEDGWPLVLEERWLLGPALKRNGERRFSATYGWRKRRVSYGRQHVDCGGAVALTGKRSSESGCQRRCRNVDFIATTTRCPDTTTPESQSQSNAQR
jgi:hypothetical protein